jgi:hypothetical protein
MIFNLLIISLLGLNIFILITSLISTYMDYKMFKLNMIEYQQRVAEELTKLNKEKEDGQ